MKVFTIHNAKGGVGKTTTAENLAYNFAEKYNKKILVIDTDPQSNLTSFYGKQNENGKTVRDIFHGVEIKKCIYKTKYKNIDLIKSSTYLTEADAAGADTILEDALQTITDYDIVIIDCRPSFESLCRNAVMACDVLVTPLILDGQCRDNLVLEERVYQDIKEKSNHKIKWIAFANRFDRQQRDQRKILVDILDRHDYPLAENLISERVAVSRASNLKKPLLKHRTKNAVTLDYLDFAEELFELGGVE